MDMTASLYFYFLCKNHHPTTTKKGVCILHDGATASVPTRHAAQTGWCGRSPLYPGGWGMRWCTPSWISNALE